MEVDHIIVDDAQSSQSERFGVIGTMLRDAMDSRHPQTWNQAGQEQRALALEAYRLAGRFVRAMDCSRDCENCLGSVRIPSLHSCLCEVFTALDNGMCELVQLQRSSVYKTRMLNQRRQACRDVEANIIGRMRELVQDDPALLNGLEQAVQQAVKEEASKDVDV